MNAGQNAAMSRLFDKLEEAGSEHGVSERSAPLATILHCKCGWRAQVFCRNAMGRNSKVYAAIRKHLLQVAEYHGIKVTP